MDLVIEKGHNIPHGPQRYPFDDMLPGDSFLVPDRAFAERAKVAAKRFVQRRNNGWRFVIREVEEGWRIWRAD